MTDRPLDRLRAALDESMQPEAAYRAHPGLNWSLLKTIAKSPLHFRHRRDNPRPDSPTFRVGRAVHAAILEPERFAAEWVVYAGRRAGKAWAAFFAEHEGCEILNATEYDTVVAMASAVRSRSDLAAVLEDGRAEVSLLWHERFRGLDLVCKARADWIYHDGDSWVVLDLKTTRDVEARSFGRDAARLMYHGQLAHYAEGLSATLGGAPVRAELLVVETETPHDCGLYRLDDVALQCGRARREQLLSRYAACVQSGEWPGQLPEPGYLLLPTWELDTLDELED
jgi:hypothetical protein